MPASLKTNPKRWLITGAAGFIGSNLTEALLELDQTVIGLDNFETGHRHNIADVLQQVGPERAARFTLIEGDIRNPQTCRQACEGIDVVLHQAALGSVPRSMKYPELYHHVNAGGTHNMLAASRDAGVGRFIFASSSSVYGDNTDLPKREDRIGKPQSPYAASKLVSEIYADFFQRCFGLKTIGLRYFNVFGRRQDPNGAYAAVIPRWIAELLRGETPTINGDGETSRDFCYVENVIQANLLAATAPDEATGTVYNIAAGEQTTLNELFVAIRDGLRKHLPEMNGVAPRYAPFRPGDVRHSMADITRSRKYLRYEANWSARCGLDAAMGWYARRVATAQLD